MTAQLFLLIFGAPALGLLGGVAWWIVRGRVRGSLHGGTAIATVIAGALGLAVDLVPRLLSTPLILPALTSDFWSLYRDLRFLVAPAAGVLAAGVLALPLSRRRASSTAALTPRSLFSFVQPRWMALPAALLVILVLLTITCGVVSEPDGDTGRYTQWMMDVGGGTQIGTTIYGWYYSLPVLALVAAMIAVGGLALALIARPALAPDSEVDARRRAFRSRNVVASITASLFLTLSGPLQSVAGTASLRGQFGSLNVWTPFAALGPALEVAAFAAAACGVGVCAGIVLTATPRPSRMRSADRAMSRP